MSSIKLKHSGGNSVSLNPPTSAPTSSDVAFKLPNADGSANQVLKTDGSANLSFATVTTATNTPAFSAGPVVAQSGLTDNTFTRVAFTEIMDSDGKFANGDTFTPGVAGYYMYYASVYMRSSDSSAVYNWHVTIRKNNSDQANQGGTRWYQDNEGGDRLQANISGIVYLDADDYLQCYAFANTYGSGSVTWEIVADAGSFGAFKLAGVS